MTTSTENIPAQKLERELIDRCLLIGYIPEMNGPATASFANWLESRMDGRAIDDLKIGELLTMQREWKQWREKLYSSLTA